MGTSETWVPATGTIVTVRQTPFSATADGNGRVVVTHLPAGTYAVTFVHQTHGPPGDFLALSGIRLAAQDAIDLGAVKLNAAGALRGHVLLNGTPVGGAALQVVDSSQQPIPGIAVQRADANGNYALPFVPAGQTRVFVVFPTQSPDGSPVQDGLSDPVAVAPGVTTEADLNLHSTQTEGPATLELAATAPLGVAPPQTISVQLVQDDGTTTTSSNLPAASAKITPVQPGVYTVVVSAVGFQSLALPNELIVGDDNLGTVVLQPESGATLTCTSAQGACDPNATCAMTTAGLTCTCNSGYAGNGWFCADIDECGQTTGLCDPHATCTNMPGGYTCTCDTGYTGDGMTCQLANPCSTNNGGCDPHATCTNDAGTAHCTCDTGYTGDGMTCQLADPCLANDAGCGSNATCASDAGTAICTCNPGFANDGGACQQVDPCFTNNGGCDLHATCSSDGGMAVCTCDLGYVPDGGICQHINPCITNNGGCDPNAVCTNDAGAALCTCDPGFMADGGICQPINPCLSNNGGCDPNATCANDAGAAICACNSGYVPDGGICQHINPCITDNGGCSQSATCANDAGAAACTCNSGFAGDGVSCQDIDECLTNNGGCSVNATCLNTIGSFTCTCNSDYIGDGITCSLCTYPYTGCMSCESPAGFCGRLSIACGLYTDTDNCGNPYTADCGACTGGQLCGIVTPNTCSSTGTITVGASLTAWNILEAPPLVPGTTSAVYSAGISVEDALEAPPSTPGSAGSVTAPGVSLGNRNTSILPPADGGTPPISVTTTVQASSVTTFNRLTWVGGGIDAGPDAPETLVTVTQSAAVVNSEEAALVSIPGTGRVVTTTTALECLFEEPPAPAASSPSAYVQNQ